MMNTGGERMNTSVTGMGIEGALSVTMSRRRVLRLPGAAGAAAVVAGVAHVAPAGAASAGNYRTTADLNPRAKPSSSARILLVMPEGSVVEESGDRKNGYMKCRYGGKTGWAFEAYLQSPITNDDPNVVGVDVTNTDVNLRSGPSTGHQVLRVLNPGTEVNISDTVQNGFRYVVHLGLAGWVWDAFIGGGPSAGPEKLTTTSALNHRAKASTSAAVLAVIPSGAKVGDQGESSNGFRKVSYNGAIGWCWADYLT